MKLVSNIFFGIIVYVLSVGTAVNSAMANEIVTSNQFLQMENPEHFKSDLQSILERDDLQDKFVELGIDKVEAQRRISQLTDKEASELAAKIESMPAGGSELAILLLVIIIVILIGR